MPTYEYACNACGHRFDLLQSIKAAPVRKCPACGKLKVRRLISAGGGIIFKGSGFYATDYRSRSYQDAAKKESSPAGGGSGDGSGGQGGKSDAKPDSKPAAKPAKPAKVAE